jgi:1,4-alpha-glucan branching enzyme
MLKKATSKNGKSCRVTFELPAEVNAETVFLCGDFNDWDESALPMKRRKDGSFSTAVSLVTGKTYHFRYLLDGERWENDWEADGYAPNIHGSENSVLEV